MKSILKLVMCLLLMTTAMTEAFSVPNIPATKVMVTGAAGRTGRLVFEKLRRDEAFNPVALVRSERSGRKLISDTKCGLEQVFVCDFCREDLGQLKGLEGTEALIVCTSAVPILSKRSLLRAMVKAPINMMRGKKAIDFKSFRFKFKKNQYPELVDYQGQVTQIEFAKQIGVKKVVIVSSMGGTDPNNFLNSVGKKPDGSGNGDILLWKREAEKYLVESGLSYTIIHPGGLVDTEEGVEELVLGVNDELMKNTKRSISRADVAELCVASLTLTKNRNVSCDCITREVAVGTIPRTPEQVLQEFLKVGVTADYSL